MRDILRGTGVALVTPFRKDLSVDYDALQRLINFVIDGGVQYVVTLGTTGETATLNREEKLAVFEFTHKAVNARVPVVVGIGGNDTASVLKDLEYYPLDKAVAILSAGPYYNRPSQEGIYQHYKAMASATTKPIILYNVPGRTACNITAQTTLRLANEHENICGIKEASGNMVQCMHIMKNKPRDFFVTSGDDHLALPLIAAGMHGVISVAANCWPKDMQMMVQATLTGDLHLAKTLHYNLLKGFDLLFAENNPAGVKAVLAEMGLVENHLRLPLVPLSKGLVEEVRSFIPTLI